MKDFKVYQTSGMLNFLVSEASDVRGKEQTLSGNIVSFDADEQTALKIIADIDSETGLTGCNIKHANKNLMILDTPYKIGALSYGQNVGTIFSPAITAEGTYTFENDVATLQNTTAWRGVAIGSQPVNAGSYKFSINVLSKTGSGSSYAFDLLVLDNDYRILRKVEHWGNFDNFQYSWTINISQDNCYIVLDIGGRSSTYVTVEITDIQLEVGTVQTEYQRPNTATYQISWQTEAGAITDGILTIAYGGSVTLDTGGQTYTLQSISPIETMIGDNNIWSDAGDVSVTYPI